MAKKSLIILFLLLSTVFSFGANAYTGEERSIKNLQETSSLIAVNVTLANGTILTFTTINDYLSTIYSLFKKGQLTISDISDVLVLNWQKYKALYNTSELNESFYSKAYTLYFYWVNNATTYNYSGHIVASTVEEFLQAGIRYEGVVIYGKIHEILLKKNEEEISKDDIGELSLLIVANFSSIEMRTRVFSLINSTQGISSYLIDISNRLNDTGLPSNAEIVSLEGSKLNGENLTLALGLSTAYPVILGVYRGIIIWKSVGVDSIERAISYLTEVNELGEENYYKIAGYRIDRILGYNLYETKIAKVTVFISEGIGNANITIEYAVLDKNNKTIQTGKLVKEINYTYPVTFEIELKNGSRYLKINVSISSEFGFDHETVEFKVESIYGEKPKPKIPWATIISILLVIIIFIAGVVYYRKKY